jgi:alkylated DNA repair dioxygenase AlkB
MIKNSKVDTTLHNEPKTVNIPGFNYVSNFITKEEAAYLMNVIDSLQWNCDLKRKTQQYGYKYDYTHRDVRQKTTPIPKEFNFLLNRLVEKKIFSKLPDQIIINEYIGNQGIHKPVDAFPIFGETIASLSLLQPCVMIFHELESTTKEERQRDVKRKRKCTGGNSLEIFNEHLIVLVKKILEQNSLFALNDAARYDWAHEIPRSDVIEMGNRVIKRDENYRRVSITFRTINKTS